MSNCRSSLLHVFPAGSRQLCDCKFDVVIIDEATQALEAVYWISIFKARNLILADNPMQLPPAILSIDKHRKKISGTVISQKSTSTADDQKKSRESRSSKPRLCEEDETTLFDRLERMYGPDIKHLLKVQYRFSRMLYASKLVSGMQGREKEAVIISLARSNDKVRFVLFTVLSIERSSAKSVTAITSLLKTHPTASLTCTHIFRFVISPAQDLSLDVTQHTKLNIKSPDDRCFTILHPDQYPL
ncbi:hypothetical protein EV702DRAFT_1213710 [Suillus placidus]|uniref:DNA2/NAM7 helicase helicase domain-containing protein n=1 Tax=Suillus placidus TaxID=48579 RepID=A0A9P6ZHL4_9AGAM|nr:hypothetical protein EV702DRAFT_1213710 [Suillus placidus]